MIRKILFVSYLSFGFFQATQANEPGAGLFIEPALTYEVGRSTVDYPSPLSSSTGDTNGFGLGARFGLHISEILFLAVDGRYSMPRYQDSSVNYTANSVSTNWGPALGVQMPEFGMRIWGSVVLGGGLNPEKSNGFDVSFGEPSGYRIGTGFRISDVSLNIEYQQMKYGNATLEEFGPFSLGSTFDGVTLQDNSWILSVSFPLAL